jgi:hypothetical protein
MCRVGIRRLPSPSGVPVSAPSPGSSSEPGLRENVLTQMSLALSKPTSELLPRIELLERNPEVSNGGGIVF